MSKLFLSLGSNIGDSESIINRAIDYLQDNGLKILKKSSLYLTEPWGEKNQPWFLNLVIECKSNLPPGQILKITQSIEKKIGRKKREKWAEREIDIDIILYEDLIIGKKKLIIPHPHLENRRFVLVPLMEIEPKLIHPVTKLSIQKMLENCPDKSKIELQPPVIP